MHPTSSAHSSEDMPNASISEGLAKLALAVQQRAWRDANALGLSPTQMQILVFLRRRGDTPATLGAVARDLGLTAATVSDAVRVLVTKALVQKDRAPGNPRALALTLTLEGSEVAAHISNWPHSLELATADLNPEEQATFVRGLSKVIRHLERCGDISVARLCVTCANFRPHHHPDPAWPHHCVLMDAPLAERTLRLDCDEHESGSTEQQRAAWSTWLDIEQRR
ncbi:MarR family transcriptional regulator [Deinococcus sp. HMF7620]|uniref:MarR family transcriptional regulator n=1 Tax=Deinococcus arboris TaxID=2682977 RepID=A0A7C9LQ33_9DEIO|nr:MarR family winged helix-turn-helix transcriptional regulator [Deinococcus arboris]MVN88256.1 MarR family transcriptional regulator [Deinococcus arboris]